MKKHYSISRNVLSMAGACVLLIALCFTATTPVNAQLPANIDFSLGNFTNWLCYTGVATTGPPATGPNFSSPVLSGPIAGPPSRHALTSGSGTDPYGGFSAV